MFKIERKGHTTVDRGGNSETLIRAGEVSCKRKWTRRAPGLRWGRNVLKDGIGSLTPQNLQL